MRLIKNGDTSRLIHVLMIDAADHITGKTGLTLTITRSKNGGAFASWAGTSAEVANGWYKLTPAAGDVDTQGDLVIHVTATGADPTDAQALVVAFDPHDAADLGLSAVPIDLAQAVPTTNTAQTVGDALNAARAQGFGKWSLSGTTLTLYAADGTTVVRTFTLDSATAPTART